MKVQVTESGTWRRTLEIEAPAEAVEARLQAAYKKYSKSLNLPGFRKGRVPVGIVKAQFGRSIQAEVLQEMVEEFYREASQAEGLQPVSEASIEDVNFEEGQPLTFKASVDVKPDLHIEHYKGLKVIRPVFRVESRHVETQLRAIQEENATEQVVERPAALGDVLMTDIQELDPSGLPLIGRKQEDREIRLGGDAEAANHDLDNQLVGIAAGEVRQIRVTHSDDHTGPGQAGREVRFQVTAKEIREHTLPELDDELAKDVGDFESMEALKERIQTDLQERADALSRRRLEENLVDALIRQNAFEIPESMVENTLDNLVESYKQEHDGHDHDIDEDAIRQEGREGAIRSVRRFLLLDAIASQEGVETTDGDIDTHLESLSERHNIEGPRLRQLLRRSGQLERIESDLQNEKIFSFLIEQTKVEDVEEAADG